MRIFTTLVFVSAAGGLFAQELPPITNGWALFAGVKYTNTFYKEHNEYFLKPSFDQKIKRFEGQEILLKGHFMPLDYVQNNVIILSKHPYSSCFFCGAAGPETVAEIYFKTKKPKLKADQVIQVSGKLKLNDTNIEHMNFILTEAEIIPK
jgi:hypothetical protein